MSVTVVKDETGVTVITVEADKKSMLSPLCQILKTLCYSPTCCSVHKGLMRTSVTAALGTIQIMGGLFNIAVGPGRSYMYSPDERGVIAAHWLGAMFIATGIMSLLAGGFPSLFLMVFAVILNIVGSILAFAGCVLYAIGVTTAHVIPICEMHRVINQSYAQACRAVAFHFLGLVTIIDLTMVVLAVLLLCVCISFAVLGIKAVVNRKKEEVGKEDQPQQLKEVLLTSPDA
ncbi:uncharacterized protein LOC121945939 [Plectropomus leopardus]|uniref:uncharacterized protein LOC121945939 n=1 Tax=Plectropomus leopardus TaxID=160734 RepID=UPI001C4CF03E|nr:uncharacterized protein LOC121945939 [Plectropomus leopardus]XP_042346251.1 uncharacterized protein LOC121945939 [Plectropomus leopardus]XP_042346252.1 uncharacterized protein LOC121945939 [Plectropomus leopardus]